MATRILLFIAILPIHFIHAMDTIACLKNAITHTNLSGVKEILEKNNFEGNTDIRRWNFIYNEQQLKRMLIPLVDYMLKVETHNAIHQDDQHDCSKELNAKLNASKIREAILVDKLLEDKGILTPFKDNNQNPLLQLLIKRQSRQYRKTFAYLYKSVNLADNIPKSLLDIWQSNIQNF